MADIPDAARKCKHCGEWVDKPATTALDRGGVDEYFRWRKKQEQFAARIGCIWVSIILLIMLIVGGLLATFYLVFQGDWNKVKEWWNERNQHGELRREWNEPQQCRLANPSCEDNGHGPCEAS
jgi:hypothetical protein